MRTLPTPLQPLSLYNQFILYVLTDDNQKKPINYKTLLNANPHDPGIWLDAQTALHYASTLGAPYGVGFVFTGNDPFWFLDIDGALQPDNTWSALAQQLIASLPGAAVEVSQSGRGLHIIGSGAIPAHSCKNTDLNLELYHELRFCALAGVNATGDASVDLTQHIAAIVAGYFPPKEYDETDWTDKPVSEWNGSDDDQELIAKAIASTSATSVFGKSCGFKQLWDADADALSEAYPPNPGSQYPYDPSTVDAALAQHLAFWTGNNHERIRSLMLQSGLIRDKWTTRPDYLLRTITRAVSLQETVYTAGASDNTIADENGAPKLRAKSDKQRDYANSIRAGKLKECGGDTETLQKLCAPGKLTASAKFWIDNQELSPQELAQAVTPITEATGPVYNGEVVAVHGYQYLPTELQLNHFKGCVYIQDRHRVFTPTGAMLKADQFNATYGGYIFQLDESGQKTTRKAWEAFTESQVIRRPIADGTCFRPALETGALVNEEGRTLVNTYVPVETPRMAGDPAPFLDLLRRMLPVERDRSIILSYMAACIQYKGVKFQWAPLIQGAEGNGKTAITRCMVYAIGKRYSHYPKAADIDNKFNSWLLNKLFIGVEDIHVPDHRREVLETLKPMITSGDGLEIQMKGVDQITADICANFILNSNHKDAIHKTMNDRRFAVFFTAQQSAQDIARDGMSGEYFPNLYRWFDNGGYAIVSEYLHTYVIPDALNPATECHRAPETSSTAEAVNASLGSVEQEILEAIDEGRPGFAGGWISSMALERLLKNMQMNRRIPHNKRRDLLQSLGYDWHPGLSNGRVNNYINIDMGKPRLFIKTGHIAANRTRPADIAKAYEAAQAMDTSAAESIFGGEVKNC